MQYVHVHASASLSRTYFHPASFTCFNCDVMHVGALDIATAAPVHAKSDCSADSAGLQRMRFAAESFLMPQIPIRHVYQLEAALEIRSLNFTLCFNSIFAYHTENYRVLFLSTCATNCSSIGHRRNQRAANTTRTAHLRNGEGY